MNSTSTNFPRRGEIFYVDFDPAIGDETQKIRPALIISNNMGNKYSGVVTAAPISSQLKKKLYPCEVAITLDHKPAKIMINQARALDKSRISPIKMGTATAATMGKVDQAIKTFFSL